MTGVQSTVIDTGEVTRSGVESKQSNGRATARSSLEQLDEVGAKSNAARDRI